MIREQDIVKSENGIWQKYAFGRVLSHLSLYSICNPQRSNENFPSKENNILLQGEEREREAKQMQTQIQIKMKMQRQIQFQMQNQIQMKMQSAKTNTVSNANANAGWFL